MQASSTKKKKFEPKERITFEGLDIREKVKAGIALDPPRKSKYPPQKPAWPSPGPVFDSHCHLNCIRKLLRHGPAWHLRARKQRSHCRASEYFCDRATFIEHHGFSPSMK